MAEVGSAFVSLMPSAKGFGKATEKQIAPDLDKSGKSVGSKFGTALKVGAVAAVGAGAALVGFAKSAVAEAREAQKVGALTNAVIKSTGGVANVTAKDVDRLATSISLKTGIDDEAIAAGQNMLLTFSKVRNEVGKGNDIFAQATVAATDMSAAFGGDAVSNSRQLGKALQDPTKGVTALTRVGVTFTQQQKDQIKTMQDSGNILGAQKIVLAEVARQTQGAAAAQATSGEKAAVAWGNLKETLGTSLLPVIDRVATGFTDFVTQVETGVGVGGRFASVGRTVASNFGTIAPVLGTVAAGLIAYRAAMTVSAAITAVQAAGTVAATGATWSLNAALRANPIGLVVTALTLLVAALVFAYKKSDTFRAVVQTAFAAVRVVVSAVIGWFARYVPQVFAAVVGAVKAYIGVYKAVILGAFAVVRAAISGIGRAWDAAVDAVSGFVSGTKKHVSIAIGIVKSIPGAITGALGNLGGLLLNAGAELINGLISGITSKLGSLRSKMGEVGSVIKGFLPGSPVKEGPLRSWNNGGAGKRLVGLLADGLSDTSPVDAAMNRLVSGATLPRSAGSLSIASVGAGAVAGGGGRMALTITNWQDGTGYFETVADGQVRGSRNNSDMRRRAGGLG